MECHIKENKNFCSCTYSSCSRQGKCCECIAYHASLSQAPGCLFTKTGEKLYDRSFEALAKHHI